MKNYPGSFARLLTGLFIVTATLMMLSGVISASAQDAAQDTAADHVGEVLVLSGQVQDTTGTAIEGAVVTLWQADANGVYHHPAAENQDQLAGDFQYYGSTATDASGAYTFRTIKPGSADGRPSHLYISVSVDGDILLTTQLYFAEDQDAVTADRFYTTAGEAAPSLILTAEDNTDADGNTIRTATINLVVDPTGTTGDDPSLTPAQPAGLYTPVIDVTAYDNDLTTIESVDAAQIIEMPEFTLLNLNTATGDDFLAIPDMSNRMVREFEEYRPYISILQFRREIGKYVSDEQVAAYEAYVYVPVDVNNADTETLKQLPGVDDTIATALSDARPFASSGEFLEVLSQYVSPADVTLASSYLAAQ